MGYRFIFTAWFDRDMKLLAKHNTGFRNDFEAFLQRFDPLAHPVIPGSGGARKARMPAKGRGKRGGYRVVYYFYDGDMVWLITMYDKAHKEDLSPADTRQINRLIDEIRNQS